VTPLSLLFSDSTTSLDILVLAASLIGIAAAAARVWSQVQRDRLSFKRDAVELAHIERTYAAGHDERTDTLRVDPSASKEPYGGDPQRRLREATAGGATFQRLEDAIADLQFRLAILDADVDDASAVVPRYMPVSVYVNSDDPVEFYALRDAVVRLLEAFEFEVVSETRLEQGSIFQKLTAKLRDPATRAELQRQAQLAHLALQQETLGKAQADINVKQAEAASAVHAILDKHDDYVIVVGSLVGVTHRDEDGRRTSMIVELTPDELIAFQRAGHTVKDASAAFRMLSAIRPEEILRQDRSEADAGNHRQLPSVGKMPPRLPRGDG
jgi:hypothetical protein